MIKLKDFFLFISLTIPKAGIKISGFPLYLSLLSSVYFFIRGIGSITKRPREFLFLIVPILLLVTTFLLSKIVYNDEGKLIESDISKSDLLAYLSSYFAFVCFYGVVTIRNAEKWKNYIIYVFYIIVIYAFIQKIFGDYQVIIPGITANFQDALTPGFLQEKNNMIWSIGYLKATSTYQNGNVFGVNLLLIGFAVIALYQARGKSYILPLSLLALAVLLTASASVYFGLIIAVLYMLVTGKNRTVLVSTLFIMIVALVIIGLTDNIISHMIQERLFNRDLSDAGGRSEKIMEYVNDVSEKPYILFVGLLFSNSSFSQVYEILPLALLQIFGLPMFIIWLSFFYCKIKPLLKTPYVLPFIAYFSASISDGAFWLPPTATNLCIVLGLCTLWKNTQSKVIKVEG